MRPPPDTTPDLPDLPDPGDMRRRPPPPEQPAPTDADMPEDEDADPVKESGAARSVARHA